MKTIRKADIFLAVGLITFALLLLVAFYIFKKSGKKVIVSQNNSIVYSGMLSEDNEIKLKHNTVVIKKNKAYMKCADCKNQICVKTGKISNSGETVVCLPNKVIIEIE